MYQTPVKLDSGFENKQPESTVEQTPSFVDLKEDSPANLISQFEIGNEEQIQTLQHTN